MLLSESVMVLLQTDASIKAAVCLFGRVDVR